MKYLGISVAKYIQIYMRKTTTLLNTSKIKIKREIFHVHVQED